MNALSLITDGFLCPINQGEYIIRYVLPLNFNIQDSKLNFRVQDTIKYNFTIRLCEDK